MTWEGLSPPYSTIVADPPWHYPPGGKTGGAKTGFGHIRQPPYSMMPTEDVVGLPVADLAARDAHLYLWTTNRHLRESFEVLDGWGFVFSKILTWCKPPQGMGPGGYFCNTSEFVLHARRGSLKALSKVGTTWFEWPRSGHSTKPAAFLDLVEQVSPGPYVELFARAPRLGWDSWGRGYELTEAAS